MPKVTSFLSMSLDGFTTGPNVSVNDPMGEGGEKLHDWMFNGKTESEAVEFQERFFRTTGAIIAGRRMFDLGVEHWGDNPVFHAPVFVLSHNSREKLVKQGGTTYSFVTDGAESALEQAKTAAGNSDVMVIGGANVIQQFIQAGWLDEIEIHLVPMLVGGGSRLFDHRVKPLELERIQVTEAPDVTHLRFRIVK
jgi:dihydrofolate reductase